MKIFPKLQLVPQQDGSIKARLAYATLPQEKQGTSDMIQPPVGLRPKYIVDAIRMKEILEACLRYSDACLQIPDEWIQELVQINHCMEVPLTMPSTEEK